MAKAKEKAKSSQPSKKWEMIKEGRKHCPNCGIGVYLGKHANPNRLVCGKCGYVEFL